MTVSAPERSTATRLVDVDGLIASFPALRDRLVDEGATPTAAATYLAGWFGGGAAAEAARSLIAHGSGPLADRRTIRWRIDRDGMPDGVELGEVPSVVAAGHPASSNPGVRLAADPDARDAAVATALIEAVRPVIDACHRPGRVGWVGLWNEVADGFAYGLPEPAEGRDPRIAVDVVERLTAVTGAPWRRRPTIIVVETATGPLCVLRKGGCCLAFTGTYGDDPEAFDDVGRAYLDRFADPPDAPGYCITCPRRSLPDCEMRQVWWHERGS